MSNIAPKSGTNHNSKYWSNIAAPFGQLSVTESVVLPPNSGATQCTKIGAISSKGAGLRTLSRESSDQATKAAWAEIAIEWHALANRIAQDAGIRANQRYPQPQCDDRWPVGIPVYWKRYICEKCDEIVADVQAQREALHPE